MKRRSITITDQDGHSEEITFEEGSGNVFADLGFPNPEEHLQKVRLLHRLDALLTERGFTQIQAAELLGIDQPSLSRLLRGAVRGFSMEKLMQFLARLDQHVLIVVAPRDPGAGVVSVDVTSDTADHQALVVRVASTTPAVPASRRTRGPVRKSPVPVSTPSRGRGSSRR